MRLARLLDGVVHLSGRDRLDVRHHEVEAAVLLLDRRPAGTSMTLSSCGTGTCPSAAARRSPGSGARRSRSPCPTGSTNGKSASTMSAPITATGAARSTSAAREEAALLDVAVVDVLVGLGDARGPAASRARSVPVLDGVGRDPLQRARSPRPRACSAMAATSAIGQALAAAPLLVVDVLAGRQRADEDRRTSRGSRSARPSRR